MEMNEELYEEIVALCEKGDALFENDQFEQALHQYTVALDLVPAPKTDWEASTWIYSSLGDIYFCIEEYEKAKHCFYDAYNCPDGIVNPFILLRLGEILYECGELDKAKEFLLRAYMLEGDEIFQEEDDKYIALIESIL